MTAQTIRHVDLTVADLVEHAIRRQEGILADNGALVVKTGHRTGRSPKDRYIVKESTTEQDIQWGNVNQPVSGEVFNALWDKAATYLSDVEHFVSHLEVGADPDRGDFAVTPKRRTAGRRRATRERNRKHRTTSGRQRRCSSSAPR